MGLEDVSRPIGTVTSGKKEIEIDRRSLEWVISSNPHIAETLATGSSDESIKALIDILDDVAMNELEGINTSGEIAEESKKIRGELIGKI